MIKPRMIWARYISRVGKKWYAYRILVGKPEGKGQLGRPIHWQKDNIEIDLV
jgi:hypothetical protein